MMIINCDNLCSNSNGCSREIKQINCIEDKDLEIVFCLDKKE